MRAAFWSFESFALDSVARELLGSGKLIATVAYQMVARVKRPYDPKNPANVAYIKFFLQY